MIGIPTNTRFCPTVSGPLHLGHLYTILVNEHEAHKGGGRFHVRFDDTQAIYLDRLGWGEIRRIKEGMIADLAWLGVRVDSYLSQSEIESEAHAQLAARCHASGVPCPRPLYCAQHFPAIVGRDGMQAYPYVNLFTAEKVIMDRMQDISVLIRGEDLIGEFSLYCYWCDVLSMTTPDHVYLPRLRVGDGLEMSEVSKTDGNYRLADFRLSGWSPAQVVDMLGAACKKDIAGPWSVDNIKSYPLVGKVIGA